jgi:hypothetical protein
MPEPDTFSIKLGQGAPAGEHSRYRVPITERPHAKRGPETDVFEEVDTKKRWADGSMVPSLQISGADNEFVKGTWIVFATDHYQKAPNRTCRLEPHDGSMQLGTEGRYFFRRRSNRRRSKKDRRYVPAQG